MPSIYFYPLQAYKINDESIELLIHAGDFVAPFTSQSFKELKAPLVGVFGNNDGDKLLLKALYKENEVGELHEDPYEFELAAKKIHHGEKNGGDTRFREGRGADGRVVTTTLLLHLSEK